jgi:ankyrin repeat protein
MGACRHLWLTLLITALLSWGSNIILIGPLLADENDPREKLTELLFRAVKTNNINAVRTAIEAGAKLSRINLNGKTAMDIAISNNHFKIANYLVFARRIEQEAILKSTPMINSVQQASPEAAPVVKISVDNFPGPQQSNRKNNILPTNIKQKLKKESKQSPIKQIKMTTQKTFNDRDQTVTNTSKTKSQAPQQKLLTVSSNTVQEKFNETVRNVTNQDVSSAKSIFFMDAEGNIIKSTVEEIKRFQKTIRQNAARLLPDIEPRKSLFIPKPRLKPSFSPLMASRLIPNPQNRAPKVATKLDIIAPKTPNLSLSKNRALDVQKTSNSQKAKSQTTKIDYITTNRRISPELINKLRRGLEKSKRQKKIDTGGKAKIAVKKRNFPTIAQPRQKKKFQIAPLPVLKVHPRTPLTVAPKLQLNDKTRIEKSESEKKNIFGKFFSNLTTFLGVTSDPEEAKKKIKPLGNEARTDILFQQAENLEQRVIETQTIDQPIKKRPSTQLSLSLETEKHETTNSRFEPTEGIQAKKNNLARQFHKKMEQTKLQLNKKNIALRRQNTNKK